VTSVWYFVAPDRLSYQIPRGPSAIVIGVRRWDRVSPGGPWSFSNEQTLRQPVPFWRGVSDAHVLGLVEVGDRPAWLVSFFDPHPPAWFTAAIDRATLRTLDLRMVATAHFMHELYGPFNEPLRIRPPRVR
jgi:hypothetical protein